jgi:hypothetical protein
MPKLHGEPLHRLHIMVSQDDYKWLKKNLGEAGQISETFRMIIRRLRGKKIREPQVSVVDILEREEFTL